MEKVKPTIRGKLVFDSAEDKAFLLYAMRNFKDAVEYAHSLMRKGLKRNKIERILTSRILKNKWYSISAFKKARLYRDKPYLKLRRPQLFSVGGENENGNRNIRFDSTNMVRIKIPSTTGRHRWITAKTQFGKEQIPIVNELVNPSFPYSAGVSLKNNEFRLYVNVPLELYVEHMRKKSDAKIVGYIAGFDFNPDRINMVIIDSQGIIRDIQNEDFPEVTSPGFPKEKSETIRKEKLAKLVKYARNHGVKYYAVEKLSKPKPEGCRNAKRKISKMALKQFIQQIEVLVPKVNGVLVKVPPAYSSVSAKIIAEDLGIDIHTASAYIIALRGYKKIQKNKKQATADKLRPQEFCFLKN